jgi:RHS repeat-associated protein
VDNGTTASYLYDAEGHRAGTTVGSTSREFIFDLSNHLAGMMQTTGGRSWNREEIYAGSWHLASYVSGALQFNHADWLGTVRVRTNTSGSVINSYTNLPFGDCLDQNGGSNCDGLVGGSPAHFTDQDRDTETGLDHFLFRQYSAVQGRWMRPDPAGMAAVDSGNPQTWNQYAYVENAAMSAVDPLGLCPAITIPGHCASTSGEHRIELEYGAELHGTSETGYWWEFSVIGSMLITGNVDSGEGGEKRPACLAGAGPLLPGQSRCAANNGPQQTKQQCIQNALQNKFGNFLANKVIPEFSLFSLRDNWRAFVKGSALSTGLKLSTWGTALAYGRLLTTTGTNLAQYPGMAAASADALEAGAFWTTTAATTGTVLFAGVAAVTTFSTGADYWARQQCTNIP